MKNWCSASRKNSIIDGSSTLRFTNLVHGTKAGVPKHTGLSWNRQLLLMQFWHELLKPAQRGSGGGLGGRGVGASVVMLVTSGVGVGVGGMIGGVGVRAGTVALAAGQLLEPSAACL